MEVSVQSHAEVTLPPGKTRYPLYRNPRAGLDGCEKSPPTPGIRSRNRPAPIQSVRKNVSWKSNQVSTKTIFIVIYLLDAIGLTPSGSSTGHIYTQTIHTTQLTTLLGRLSGIQIQSGQTEINDELTA